MLVLLLAKLSDPEESNWKKTKIESPSVGDYFLAMAEFKYSRQLKSCVRIYNLSPLANIKIRTKVYRRLACGFI